CRAARAGADRLAESPRHLGGLALRLRTRSVERLEALQQCGRRRDQELLRREAVAQAELDPRSRPARASAHAQSVHGRAIAGAVAVAAADLRSVRRYADR